MQVILYMTSEAYLYMFAGTAQEAADAPEEAWIAPEEGGEMRTFTLPLKALDDGEPFAAFSKTLGKEKMEIFYQETNALQAVKNILEVGYNLGIIRYAAGYDKYFKQMMAEKGLKGELVAEFKYVLVMREDCALAAMETIRFSDLQQYIQIAHADPYVPSLPLSAVRNEELPQTPRRIFVFERGSQLDLLTENPETFMWVSPLPERLLRQLHLVQRECAENQRVYRDVLIHRQDYQLTELDKRFITELTQSKRACITRKK